MSDTDIYKKREAMPRSKNPPKKQRRRRSSSARAFDDKSRKRRSKNSGARRWLHLFRKSENEKNIWIVMGVVFVATLLIVGIWQFFIQEHLIREQERSDDYLEEYELNIPPSSKESLMSTLTTGSEQEKSASE